jgi:isopenicillin-N epimerase
VRDLSELKARLYDQYKIEVPCLEWNGQHYLRVSVQGYNSEDDLAQLMVALKQLLTEQAV